MAPTSALRVSPTLTSLSFSAWLAFLAHGANDAMTGLFSALLPGLQDRLALGAASLSLLVAAFHVAGSLSQPLMGQLADRMGHRRSGAIGLAASTTFLSLAMGATEPAWVLALVMAGGLGSALLHPAAASMASAAPGRREWVAGLYNFGGLAGMALGPVAGLFLVNRFGAWSGLALIAPGLVVSALVLSLPPESADVAAAARPAAGWKGISKGRLSALALAATLGAVPFLTFSNTMPLWLVRSAGIAPDSSLIGASLSVLFLASGAGGLSGGLLVRRFRREHLALASLFLAPLAFLSTLRTDPGSGGYFAGIAAGGLLASLHFPLLLVAAQESAPAGKGMVSGLMLGFANGTAGILVALVGGLLGGPGSLPALVMGYLAAFPAGMLAFLALDAARSESARLPQASLHGPSHGLPGRPGVLMMGVVAWPRPGIAAGGGSLVAAGAVEAAMPGAGSAGGFQPATEGLAGAVEPDHQVIVGDPRGLRHRGRGLAPQVDAADHLGILRLEGGKQAGEAGANLPGQLIIRRGDGVLARGQHLVEQAVRPAAVDGP